MNELAIKELWKTSTEKLEESFSISKKNTEDITQVKIQNLISSMKPVKIFAIIAGIFWVGFGISALIPIYLYEFETANKYFLFSASIQILLTLISLIVYINQTIKIYQIDVTEVIIKTQEKLSYLKISTLWVTRILFLQLPIWTTFWWNEKMFTEWKLFPLIITVMVTIVFASIALWLFINIKYENRHKKWFKLMFSGKEWLPIVKSMQLLEQVEEYKH